MSIDLFAQPDPNANPRDRQARPDTPQMDDTAAGYQPMSDPAEMIEVFENVVTQQMPPEEDIAQYVANNHRTFMESGDWPVNGHVGRQSKSHFAWTVLRLLDPGNLSTGINQLRTLQGNGRWVPTACAVRKIMRVKMDGTRKSRESLQDGMTVYGGGDMLEAAPREVPYLEWRIQWTDSVNAPWQKYDARGQLVVDQVVNVNTAPSGTDPALLAVLTAQGQAMSALATSIATRPVDLAHAAPPDDEEGSAKSRAWTPEKRAAASVRSRERAAARAKSGGEK